MRLPTALLIACTGLAGCGVERASPAAQLPIADGDARVEWRGLAGCVDCDGIDTVLVLERAGDTRRYDLSETFLAPEGATRFGEVGDWRMDEATVHLDSDDGARRRYAVSSQGALRPQDAPAGGGTGLLLPYQAATR